MRHLTMLNEEAEGARRSHDLEALLSDEIDNLVEALGDDWSLIDAEEIDLETVGIH